MVTTRRTLCGMQSCVPEYGVSCSAVQRVGRISHSTRVVAGQSPRVEQSRHDSIESVALHGLFLHTEGNSKESSDVETTAGNTAVFAVTLSQASTSAVTVNFDNSDGSAHAGTDYKAVSGVLTFSPGTRAQSISVTIYPDTTAKPMREIAMWSLSRDQEDPAGALSYAEDNSSSLVQTPFEFSDIFNAFTG